ncbi:uncharacterized protein LOC143423755 isoform X2 [Xylocopa sonorina]|uniref:uncharacterized protein LOC143423755 isoform X2 n=1 Tax=Xylocopa sonorina TaxID=1818115 RepID=UPI00403B15B4
MWFILLAICTFKITCMFVFIVHCVVTFLLIVVRFIFVYCNSQLLALTNPVLIAIKYNAQTEELKKCIVPQDTDVEAVLRIKNRGSVGKLEVLAEKLAEKERVLQKSQCKIKNARKLLCDSENKTSSCRHRYCSLTIELKRDIRKTEDEVRTLQNEISDLSIRREALRGEVLKQEDYQKMLNNFTKELENKKTLFSSSVEKSRHPRVSYFA